MAIKLSSVGIEFGNTSRDATTSSNAGFTASTVDVYGPNTGIWFQDQPNVGTPSPWWGNDSSGNGWTGGTWLKPHHIGHFFGSVFTSGWSPRIYYYPIYIDTGFKGDKTIQWLEINVYTAYTFNSGGALKAALYDVDRANYYSGASRFGGAGLPKTLLCEFNYTSVATSTGTKSVNASSNPTVYRGWYFIAFMIYNVSAGAVRGSYGGSGSNSGTYNLHGPYTATAGTPSNFPGRAFYQTISSNSFPSTWSTGSNGWTSYTPYFALGTAEV